jgi:TolA-binding protein
VVALAAVAAGIFAFANNRPVEPTAPPEQAAAAAAPETVAAPEPPPAPPATVDTPAVAPPPVVAKGPSTPAPAGNTTAGKPAGTTAKATAKPGAPAPVESPAAPAASSRETEASQKLDVAKAKLSNSLNDQALSDLREIMSDYPGTHAAVDAAFLAGETHEKVGRIDDAMAAYVEFESRYGQDKRAPDAKLRRALMLGRQRQPKPQALSLQLFGEVARDYPKTPQAAMALQNKLRAESERNNLRATDPVLNIEVPAAMVTLRQIIEQFPDAPETMGSRNRLAMMLTQMNRHAEAAQVLEDMGAHGDNPMDSWFRLGEIYERRLNDPAKAREAYAKVPPASPKYNDAQKKLNKK